MTRAFTTPTAEWIAAELRQEIARGVLKAGQPLPQEEIAARFGVSKIPAREALLQLRAEGLVTFYPNRGAVVSQLSAEEVEEIYAMRIALETLALRRAVLHLTRADFVRLEGLIVIMDEEPAPLKWSELNWEFHATLYRPCGMPRLLETVRVLHANVQRYVAMYLANPEHHAEAQAQHRAILATCRQGDADAATTLLAQHLQHAADKMRKLLDHHTTTTQPA